MAKIAVNLEPPTVGDNLLVAGVAYKSIWVYYWQIDKFSTNDIYFRDGAGGAQLGVKLYAKDVGTPGVALLSGPGDYCFKTTAGNGLYLNCSVAANVSVYLGYYIEKQ